MKSDERRDGPVEPTLQALRRREMESVRPWIRPGLRVLEVGGGDGFQAAIMDSLGCQVLSIDLAGRDAPARLFHPVSEYDGVAFPAANASIDLVFSSNVLEHVADLGRMFGEIRRVLKPDGVAVHVQPSSSWRLWTSLAAYPYVMQRLLGRPGLPGAPEEPQRGGASGRLSASPLLQRLARTIALPFLPHGEYANALVELHSFGRRRWRRVFDESGFTVTCIEKSGIFYTGFELLPGLSLKTRERLARVLGSASDIYVMRRAR